MEICYDAAQLTRYMNEAVDASPAHPVLIAHFLAAAIEVDVDAVSDGKDVEIRASLCQAGDGGRMRARFDVIDSGIGIGDENRSKLFQAFEHGRGHQGPADSRSAIVNNAKSSSQHACPAQNAAKESARRRSQVCFAHPEIGYPVMQALIARGVIGDFRAPDILRFGFTPLYLRFVDVWDAAEHLREVLQREEWRQPRFHQRAAVT